MEFCSWRGHFCHITVLPMKQAYRWIDRILHCSIYQTVRTEYLAWNSGIPRLQWHKRIIIKEGKKFFCIVQIRNLLTLLALISLFMVTISTSSSLASWREQLTVTSRIMHSWVSSKGLSADSHGHLSISCSFFFIRRSSRVVALVPSSSDVPAGFPNHTFACALAFTCGHSRRSSVSIHELYNILAASAHC